MKWTPKKSKSFQFGDGKVEPCFSAVRAAVHPMGIPSDFARRVANNETTPVLVSVDSKERMGANVVVLAQPFSRLSTQMRRLHSMRAVESICGWTFLVNIQWLDIEKLFWNADIAHFQSLRTHPSRLYRAATLCISSCRRPSKMVP